ncbi:hypothetical protein Bhyg_15717 [Pseudolycoriella hygida]|uniref:Uncharacterized protein n=1 Tax=Pseudolycoriella hygida TaxID=35572 RepID=A0A9Q0MJB1_9DIPT|nr:hypothetical protein Bhyg_15717 [Pseudolycoriella hygida]
MQVNVYYFIAIWFFSHRCALSKSIQKRQLYREQVSPNLGGKIPDTAFHTDRLALNQLQKAGIAVPDGVILEQRNPEVYHYSHRTMRPVYKVAATADSRYTPAEGRYKSKTSFETTYVMPQIAKHYAINVIRPIQKQLAISHSISKDQARIPAINNLHPSIDWLQYWPYKEFDSDFELEYHPYFYENFSQGFYSRPNILHDFATFFDSYIHQ